MAKETNAQNAQAQQPEFVKSYDDSVIAAIKAASEGLKGDPFESLEKAKESAGGDEFFNPTLSQYKEGMYINTDESVARIKKVAVGRTGSRKAWCISCPVGYKDAVSGEIKYNGAFNFYPSTLRKTIQVTDEMGDPVLDENKQPVVRENKDNAVYQAARACTNAAQLLDYAMNKVFRVSGITRDFGPSVFVAMKDGSNKATGHKITSMPSFEIVG